MIHVAGTDTVNTSAKANCHLEITLLQTVSLLMSTFLALSYHPGVQREAQKELDAVIGHGRLPSYSDQKDLPYIQSILKEVQRMYPVTPLGESSVIQLFFHSL